MDRRTADLSEGGLAVEDAPVELQLGQSVALDLYLDDEVVHATGVVVWSGVVNGTGPRCGIAFEDFEAAGMDVLRRFLRLAWLRMGKIV